MLILKPNNFSGTLCTHNQTNSVVLQIYVWHLVTFLLVKNMHICTLSAKHFIKTLIQK